MGSDGRRPALRLKPAEAAIAKLSDDTPLTEDQAAVALGVCLAHGIPAAEAYPTIRALAIAHFLRILETR